MSLVTTTDNPRLLTPALAATFLGVSTMTVYRLLNKGELPGVKVGRSWRIPQDRLLALLADDTEAGG